MRGIVLPLTPEQVVRRALYLAGEAKGDTLDKYVRTPAENCVTIYYRLQDHNGGSDPYASDPASRWTKDGSPTVFITSDCMGGAAWCAGFDRYQPKTMRDTIGFGGWWNTNSMIMDVELALKVGEKHSFESLSRPVPGSMIVCKSGSRGHKVGHVGTVVGYKLAEWDPKVKECWDAIEVVDVAARSGRANKRTTGRGWFDTGAHFLRSVMSPTP